MSHIDSIKKTCDLISSPGQVVEVRAFRKRGVSSGYFTDYAKLAEKVAMLDADPEYSGIYLTLNEINPDLLARRSNRFEMRLGDKERTTSDDDIISRRWFPIDIDPKRPSGISSSDEEHEKALRKAEQVRRFLSERGWPEPISADSGNGAHLLYPISLPNDGESSALIKSCLSVLSMFFSDDDSDVDTSVSNAARIWKLYGTISRKGDSTPERPHRRSSILHVPDTLEIVSPSLLTSLASLLSEQPEKKTEPKTSIRSSVADLGAWLSDHHLSYREKPFAGGRLFLFDACPFSTAHTDGAYAIQFASGGIFAGCHHNSCGGGTQRWSELRERFEGPRPKQDYDARIKQSNRNRAKAKVDRDGYRYDSGHEGVLPERDDSPDCSPSPAREKESLHPASASASDLDPRQEALRILNSEDPLLYSLKTFALDHEGDEVVAECLALSLASRAIANPKSKGLHVLVTGTSGKGKTDAFDVMLAQVPDVNRLGQRISDKALFYAETLLPGMVITLDDTGLSDQMQEILKGVTSSFQKPFRYLTVNKDRKSQTCVIPERCVWWISKVEGAGDDQIWNRMLTTWIDDSEQQDLKVLSRTLRSARELPLPEATLHPEIKVCREMWGILFSPVWVVIPYSEQIRFTSVSNRRNPDMLIDLIRTHAIMNQFQRERQEIGGVTCVTATMEDFSRARSLYIKLCGESGGQTTKLTRKEAELITAIRNLDREEVTIPQLQRFTGLSYNTIYRTLHGYSNKGVIHSGLLEKCPALSFTDRTISGEHEGFNVKRRAKAYLWDALVYDAWSGTDGCWISDLEISNGLNDDSDDNSGDNQGSLHSLHHPCSSCCTSTDDNATDLEKNTQPSPHGSNVCSTAVSPGTPGSVNDTHMDSHHDLTSAANQDHISSDAPRNHSEQSQKPDISLHPVVQTDAKNGKNAKNGTYPPDPGADHSIPLNDTKEPCSICKPPNGSLRHHTDGCSLSKASNSRTLMQESESLRTLPGVLNISRMQRTTTDYGKCHVCKLQGIAWWDFETKTGLCQTCYERETLLGRGVI